MNEQLIDYIKQHPKLIVAQDFELSFQKTQIDQVQFLNGEEAFKNEEHAWWIYLKVLHRNKPGTASTSIPSEESLSRLIDCALKSAEDSSPDPWFRFPLWSTRTEPVTTNENPPPPDFWGSVFRQIEGFPAPLQESYEWWKVESRVFRRSEKNAKQFQHQTAKQSLTLGKLGDVFWGLSEPRIARALDLKRSVLLETAPMANYEKGSGAISLSPRAMAPLLEHVAQWFFPQSIRKGASPFSLSDREEGSLSTCLSLVDEGRHLAAPWHSPFDTEGVSTQKNLLLDRGFFKEAIYDSYQGAVENKRSTGNSLRYFGETEPRLGFRHLKLLPGTQTEAQFWDQHLNGHAFESWSQIRFSSPFEVVGTLCGWEIRGGSKGRPVKLTGVKWDLRQLLSKALQVSTDLKSYNFVSTPTTFFEGNL